MMQSVCERRLIRLKTFSFTKRKGGMWGRRERPAVIITCAFPAFPGLFLSPGLCEIHANGLYDGKVANIFR